MFNSFKPGGISTLFGESEPLRVSLVNDEDDEGDNETLNDDIDNRYSYPNTHYESTVDHRINKSGIDKKVDGDFKEDVYFSMSGWSNRSHSPKKRTSPQAITQQQQQNNPQSGQDSLHVRVFPNQQQNQDSTHTVDVISPLSDNVSFGLGVGDQGAFVKLDGGVNKVNNASLMQKSKTTDINPLLSIGDSSGGSNFENQKMNNNRQYNNIGTSLSSVSQINNGETTANSKGFKNSSLDRSKTISTSSAATVEINKSKRYFRTFNVLSFLTLLVFLLSYGTVVLNASCRDFSNRYCLPVASVQFNDAMYPESPLSIMKQSVKIITYYTANLIGPLSILDSPDFEDHLGLLSSKDIVRLNQLGYCKYNMDLEIQQCFSMKNGLDLINVLIKDAGYQVGLVSKQDDPVGIGTLFVDAYNDILNNALSNIENNNTNDDDDDIKKERKIAKRLIKGGGFTLSSDLQKDYQFFSSLSKIRIIGIVIPILTLAQLIISFTSLIGFISLMYLLASKRRFKKSEDRLRVFFSFFLILNLIAFLILSLVSVVELAYFTKLYRYLIDYAVLELSVGYYMQILVLLPIQFMIVMVLTFFVSKKPWLGKRL